MDRDAAVVGRKGTAGALAVLSCAMLLTGCTPDARGSAEDRLRGVAATSIDALGEALVTNPSQGKATAADYTLVATHQLLSGLESLPEGEATDTMYCFEQVGDTITTCLFFPMNVSIPSGLSGFSSSIYGCVKLSGQVGSRNVAVEDVECPSALVAWFAERADENPKAVSIEALAPGAEG